MITLHKQLTKREDPALLEEDLTTNDIFNLAAFMTAVSRRERTEEQWARFREAAPQLSASYEVFADGAVLVHFANLMTLSATNEDGTGHADALLTALWTGNPDCAVRRMLPIVKRVFRLEAA